MPLTVTVVDAFTDSAYAGNPAAVCILAEPAPDAWMQLVAREMNLSETAFAVPRPDGDHDLRWFTPTVEVDLCGHATLATAHVMGGSARFHTRSGLLTCTGRADGAIEMDFPSRPSEPVPVEPAMAAALGLPADRVVAAAAGAWRPIIEVATADDVRAVTPDFAAIEALGGWAIATAPGDEAGVDCVSRVFVPAGGIPEDPVTGSAHCALAPYWAERLGRDELVGVQASARGGTVGMRLTGDRVVLSGRAVTVLEGTLLHGWRGGPD